MPLLIFENEVNMFIICIVAFRFSLKLINITKKLRIVIIYINNFIEIENNKEYIYKKGISNQHLKTLALKSSVIIPLVDVSFDYEIWGCKIRLILIFRDTSIHILLY